MSDRPTEKPITDEQIIDAALAYGRILQRLAAKESSRDNLFLKMLDARYRLEDICKQLARERDE